MEAIHELCEREVRDLPVFEFRATVIIELYRLRCPDCGPKMERVEQLPSKAPFAKRFEEAVGQSCEAAAARQVARPFRLSIEQWAPECRIIYDKFHIMQHANRAIDEVRRAEFFRKGGTMRGLVKGKRWLLLTRWVNLSEPKRQELSRLFALNRKLMKAYLLKESLGRLWTYHYEGAMMNYLRRWIDPLRWQRLEPFQKLADLLVQSPRRHHQLLPDQGADGRRRSHQWQPENPAPPWPRLQELALLPTQSPAHGGAENGIRRSQESGLKCGCCRILAQSRKKKSGAAANHAIAGLAPFR